MTLVANEKPNELWADLICQDKVVANPENLIWVFRRSHANNNPLKFIDPFGLCSQSSSSAINPILLTTPNTSNPSLQNPLALNPDALPPNPVYGVTFSADSTILGVNNSYDFGGFTYDGQSISSNPTVEQTLVPSLVNASVGVNIGFDNSTMFQEYGGALTSYSIDFGSGLGASLSENGLQINAGVGIGLPYAGFSLNPTNIPASP